MVCPPSTRKRRRLSAVPHLVWRWPAPYIVAAIIVAASSSRKSQWPARRFMPLTFRTSIPAASLLLAVALAGCSDSQRAAAPPPPTAVTVANPVKRTIIDQDEYVGRFVAVDAGEIRARLSGYLNRISFQDGQMVNQGDLLFT